MSTPTYKATDFRVIYHLSHEGYFQTCSQNLNVTPNLNFKLKGNRHFVPADQMGIDIWAL